MTTLERLIQFLRIPSVSTDPARAPEVHRAAVWVRDALLEAGFLNACLIEAEGRHPLVYAERCEQPGKPVLLLYGHYDVQPEDPVELWRSPPFEPEVRGDDIFARGACDDKGQTLILLEALRQLQERDGALPVNVKILIEGEEEAGGEHIEAYVAAHRKDLACDAALICDTEMFAPGLPTLCTGLRGIVYGEIHVQGPAQDLHSGVYGGAAPNAIEAAARIVAELKGRDGVIRIPGFYDGIEAPAGEELAAWASLHFDEQEYRRREVGSPALTGESGFTVLERTWSRPTFEVHGIAGGWTGTGAKTVIPARAVVKISCRLVPGQDPDRIQNLLREAIAAAAPQGTTARFELLSAGPASVVDPAHPLIEKAADALAGTFGRKTVYMRSGGSIPIVGLFQRELGAPSVLMGFGLPDDNLHAPNEKFHLPNLYKGIEAVTNYLRLLGA
jgi:acetylornithine deacetylase/succinyl-diaminopimelate desuccinylase-like protein